MESFKKDKLKNNFIKNVVNMLVVSISMGTCSCMLSETRNSSKDSRTVEYTETTYESNVSSDVKQSNFSNDTTYMSSNNSEVVNTSPDNTAESTIEPTYHEPVTIDNYYGTILQNYMTIPVTIDEGREYYKLLHNDIELFVIGFDNELMRKRLIDASGVANVTMTDFQYFQEIPNFSDEYMCPGNGYDINNLNYSYFKYAMPIARYILAKNDLCFLTDEIPYSFFEEKFPDIIDKLNNGESVYECDDELYNLFYDENVTDKISNNVNYMENIDGFRKVLFVSLVNYNYFRAGLIYDFNHNYDVHDEIKQRRCLVPYKDETRELNRLIYNKYQYGVLTSDLQDVYGYEFNLLEPESIDSLREHGIDVEKIDNLLQGLIDGPEFEYETYSYEEEFGKSKTRQG